MVSINTVHNGPPPTSLPLKTMVARLHFDISLIISDWPSNSNLNMLLVVTHNHKNILLHHSQGSSWTFCLLFMWPPLYHKEHILLYRGGHTVRRQEVLGRPLCFKYKKKKLVFFCVLEIQSQFVLSVTQSVKLSMCEKWEDKIVEIGSKYTWSNKKKINTCKIISYDLCSKWLHQLIQ